MGATLNIEIKHRWCSAVTWQGHLVYLLSGQGLGKDRGHCKPAWVHVDLPSAILACTGCYGKGEAGTLCCNREVVLHCPNSIGAWQLLLAMNVNRPLQWSGSN